MRDAGFLFLGAGEVFDEECLAADKKVVDRAGALGRHDVEEHVDHRSPGRRTGMTG